MCLCLLRGCHASGNQCAGLHLLLARPAALSRSRVQSVGDDPRQVTYGQRCRSFSFLRLIGHLRSLLGCRVECFLEADAVPAVSRWGRSR